MGNKLVFAGHALLAFLLCVLGSVLGFVFALGWPISSPNLVSGVRGGAAIGLVALVAIALSWKALSRSRWFLVIFHAVISILVASIMAVFITALSAA